MRAYCATNTLNCFSERSAVYLASGRPVVTQDTGFSDWLPTGDGVLAFSDADQASAAIAAVTDDYEHHCRAAREMVEEYFDSHKVLRQLIEACFDNDGAG